MTSSQPTKPTTDTACLNGLRVFFNLGVVFLHAVFYVGIILDRPSDIRKLLNGSPASNFLSAMLTLGFGSVDIFLLLSGFLLKSSFSTTSPTVSSSVRYTIFRYLRLAPVYLTISFVLRSLNAPNCTNPRESLLINISDSRNLCILVGWSTQVDFVSHIVLLPLLAHPKILGSILALTPLLRGYTWIQRGRPLFPLPAVVTDFIDNEKFLGEVSNIIGLKPGNFSLTDTELVQRRDILDDYYPLYFGLQYRIAAVVVGVLLYSCMQKKNIVYRTVRRFPSVSVLSMTLVWVLFHYGENGLLVSPIAKIVMRSSGRMLIAMATSVVIMLTCSIDDHPSKHIVSRVLRKVLSSKPVTFLQQFSYVVYLLHTATAPMLTAIPPKFTTDRLSPEWILLVAAKWYLCTIVLGLPIWGIEKVALKGRRWLRQKWTSSESVRRKKVI